MWIGKSAKVPRYELIERACTMYVSAGSRRTTVPSDPGTHALGDRYSARNRRVTISPLFKGVLARYPAHVPIGSLR